MEIGRFIDQHLLQAQPLIQLDPPEMKGNVVRARFASDREPKGASLQYTTDQGPLVDRVWKRLEAKVSEDHVAATVPDEATIWCLTVTDQAGAMVTTEVVFREP